MKYEYKIISERPGWTIEEKEKELNELGQQGWRVCGVNSLSAYTRLYFIRPVIEDKLSIEVASDFLRDHGFDNAANVLLDKDMA